MANRVEKILFQFTSNRGLQINPDQGDNCKTKIHLENGHQNYHNPHQCR